MKSEILAIRIESDLLDYIRQLANNESRSIAKQVSHILTKHKAKAESIKRHIERTGKTRKE
jgi:hypothetical protein